VPPPLSEVDEDRFERAPPRRRLRRYGWFPRRQPILVRDHAKAEPLQTLPGVEVVYGDMLQPATLDQALADVNRASMISSAGPAMLETQCTFAQFARRDAGVFRGESTYRRTPA
jgi:hypothetical protein